MILLTVSPDVVLGLFGAIIAMITIMILVTEMGQTYVQTVSEHPPLSANVVRYGTEVFGSRSEFYIWYYTPLKQHNRKRPADMTELQVMQLLNKLQNSPRLYTYS